MRQLPVQSITKRHVIINRINNMPHSLLQQQPLLLLQFFPAVAASPSLLPHGNCHVAGFLLGCLLQNDNLIKLLS